MTHPTNIQLQKLADLRNYIKQLNSAAVAFSGGVDSSFLLKVAADVIGDNATAVNLFYLKHFHNVFALFQYLSGLLLFL